MLKLIRFKSFTTLLLVGSTLFLIGCGDTNNNSTQKISKVKLDGKVLLKSKCSQCHNIEFPPSNFDNEIAPAMMTISFHFNDWFKAPSSVEKLEKQLDFVSDYVINPTVDKSYCDAKMLKKYGLMPSQKGNVTKQEVRAIAKYVFTTYLPKKLAKKEEALAKFNALPKGEKLTIKYRCNGCHRVDKKVVGPSFTAIAKKYQNNPNEIINSIKNGSKGKWKGATMPSFHNIADDDILTIQKWILKFGK